MKVGIGVMAFRQAADLRRSLESVRLYQPNTDTVVFIDPAREDLDRAQVEVCESFGVPWVMHKEWRFHPGVFNSICDYFLEREYDFCINHHMDSLMLGPVVDLGVQVWERWRDEHGVRAGAVQPYILCTAHNGIMLDEWFEIPLEKLRQKGYYYNYPQRERSDPIHLAECEFLIYMPAWKEFRPVPNMYYYDRAFSAICWNSGWPIVVIPMQGTHILHTGKRTWPGSFYGDTNTKFQGSPTFHEAYPDFNGNDVASRLGVLGKSVSFPDPGPDRVYEYLLEQKYPVVP